MDEKMLARFEAKYQIEPNTGCWLWLGALVRDGYAVLGIKPNECGHASRYAHRIAYEHFRGPIPTGMDLDHLCRTRCCVNPDHLEAVSRRENLLRGVGLPAQQVTRTHCPQGHEYAGDNLFFGNDGSRRCRACSRARALRHNRKVRGQRSQAKDRQIVHK